MERYQILTAGDSALTIQFGSSIDPAVSAQLRAARQALTQAALPGVTEYMQTYCTLMVHYDPLQIGYDALCAGVRRVLDGAAGQAVQQKRRVVQIPVCYGGAFGPDLPTVCGHTGLSPQEVIRRHAGVEYQIYMLGFLPGFAYLGGMDEALATPRLATPRPRLEPGSVGIAGSQTGIYPLASPGGWQIIGRTPLRPYDPARAQPILYEAGDYLRFVPIEEGEYRRIQALVEQGQDPCGIQEEAEG